MPKNQVRILNLFRKNIFLKATILEIMHLLKNKSYQRIYESIRELERKNMVELTSIGNSQLCELRLSLETISTISFLEEQEALSRKIPCIKEMLEFKEFKQMNTFALRCQIHCRGLAAVSCPDNRNTIDHEKSPLIDLPGYDSGDLQACCHRTASQPNQFFPQGNHAFRQMSPTPLGTVIQLFFDFMTIKVSLRTTLAILRIVSVVKRYNSAVPPLKATSAIMS